MLDLTRSFNLVTTSWKTFSFASYTGPEYYAQVLVQQTDLDKNVYIVCIFIYLYYLNKLNTLDNIRKKIRIYPDLVFRWAA